MLGKNSTWCGNRRFSISFHFFKVCGDATPSGTLSSCFFLDQLLNFISLSGQTTQKQLHIDLVHYTKLNTTSLFPGLDSKPFQCFRPSLDSLPHNIDTKGTKPVQRFLLLAVPYLKSPYKQNF